MNRNSIIAVSFVLLLIVIIYCCKKGTENYVTTTYINTPGRQGVYPMYPNIWQPIGYRQRRKYGLDYNPYGWYNRIHGQRQQPRYPLYLTPPADVSNNATAPVPYGQAVPYKSLRYPWGPMLTSRKSLKDYAIGQWVYAGTAYTDNPNDDTYVQVYQLNLDPGRDMFSYSVKYKHQTIPINLEPHHYKLEDGDRFKIQGMEGKGDFVFAEANKYSYVYV